MFKRVFQHVLSAGLLFTAVSLSAAPIQYEFGYTFEDEGYAGLMVTGTFYGEETEGVIGSIENVVLRLNGAEFSGLQSYIWDDLTGFYVPGGSVSADGTANNFYFGDPFDVFVSLFAITPGMIPEVQFSALMTGDYAQDYIFNPANWFLSPVSAPVPEAGTTALLLAVALSGVALLKRRFSASA